jgi:ketosteroid isomerase-like protein
MVKLETMQSLSTDRTIVMSSSSNPIAAVLQYVDAFNSGDAKAMAAACADPMQILDGMSPHVWAGSTAAEDWWGDVLAEGEHLGASGYHITLGEPRHVDLTGDYGYVVVPATMTFNLRGDPVTQNRLALHGGASQGRQGVAFSGLGLGQRHSR